MCVCVPSPAPLPFLTFVFVPVCACAFKMLYFILRKHWILGFVVFFFLFSFSFLYQLSRLNRLDRNCNEIVRGRELLNQIATDNDEITVLISLFLGSLHIDRLVWQILWDCHKQSINPRQKMDSST